MQTTAELGTALVAFSPLGRSLLTDRPHASDKVKKMDWLSKNPRFTEPNLNFNIEAAGKFRDLAAQYGVAAATLSIAWLLNRNKLFELIAKTDLYINTSYSESLCLTVIEFLSNPYCDLILPELNIKITPEPGDYYLFPPYIFHGFDPVEEDEKRYSLIFNIVEKNGFDYDNKLQGNL